MSRRADRVEMLTPREWQVLALVREGLTNEQIAERLSISRDGVKYHVSEILSKLGVGDRIQASRWYERSLQRRTGLAGVPGRLFRRPAASTALRLPVIALISLAVLGLIALLAGVLLMRSRGGGKPEAALQAEQKTGDAELDGLILGLLNADASALQQAYAGVTARQYDGATRTEARYTAAEWTARLSGSNRELYAVTVGMEGIAPPRDFDVVLRAVQTDGESKGWQFAIKDYKVVDLMISDDPAALIPSVPKAFDQFIVLPPADDLPRPPPMHDLAVRSGDPNVDAVIEALQSHDARALLGLVAYTKQACGSDVLTLCSGSAAAGTTVDALPVLDCLGRVLYADSGVIEQRIDEIAVSVVGVHAVASLPAGYQPAGDQLLLVVVQRSPYLWGVDGLVEREGRISGLLQDCGDRPEPMYPVTAFIVAPPGPGLAPDTGRRSGVATVDAFLDASNDGDIAALRQLLDYEAIGCVDVALGIGSPPICRPDEPVGTPVETFSVVSCEGGYSRRDEIDQVLENQNLMGREWRLTAVADLGSADPGVYGFGKGQIEAILSTPDQSAFLHQLAIFVGDNGITLLQYPCGDSSDLIAKGRAPSFLLPPPP